MKFLLFVPVVAILSTGCEDKIRPSVLFSVDSKTLPQQESWNSRIVISDSGVVRAEIDAGYFRVFEAEQKTYLSEGLTVHFYGADGKPTSVLTSREGTIDEATNDLEARKNVVVRSENGTVLYSEELNWDERRQQIYTPVFVRIISPKEKLQGIGLESDQYLKNYRIFRVTGETTPQ